MAEIISDFDVLIAGAEPITEKVMAQARCLKLISPVGAGLDSVDLLAAEKRGIKVSYTQDVHHPLPARLSNRVHPTPPTPLEIAESVDMMRVLEHGTKVRMVPTQRSS